MEKFAKQISTEFIHLTVQCIGIGIRVLGRSFPFASRYFARAKIAYTNANYTNGERITVCAMRATKMHIVHI